MYSGAFLLSSSGVFIGFNNWNLNHSEKFGIFRATSYDLSHNDTVLFLTEIIPPFMRHVWCILSQTSSTKGWFSLIPGPIIPVFRPAFQTNIVRHCSEEGLCLYQCICKYNAYGQRNINRRYFRRMVDIT